MGADMSLRPFFPYYRDIRSAKGPVLPQVETQRAWVSQRISRHPFAKVIDLGVEIERGYQGPNTPVSERMDRPVLSKILEAIQSDEFRLESPVILVPDMPTHYQYKWIFEGFACTCVPIHHHLRVAKDRKRWTDGQETPPGAVELLYEMAFDDVWERINNECSYFLNVVKKINGRLLFKCIGCGEEGDKDENAKKCKKNDKDKENEKGKFLCQLGSSNPTPNINVFDNYMIICSSHPEHARSYSNSGVNMWNWKKIYAVFPRNGFKMLWSRNRHELKLSYNFTNYCEFENDVPRPSNWKGEWDPVYEDNFWYADYVTADLVGALLSENEIEISDAAYYALDWSTYRTRILNKLGFKLQNRPYVLRQAAKNDRQPTMGVIEQLAAEHAKKVADAAEHQAERRRKMQEEIAALLAGLRKS